MPDKDGNLTAEERARVFEQGGTLTSGGRQFASEAEFEAAGDAAADQVASRPGDNDGADVEAAAAGGRAEVKTGDLKARGTDTRAPAPGGGSIGRRVEPES